VNTIAPSARTNSTKSTAACRATCRGVIVRAGRYAGARSDLPAIRIITELAWHSHFARTCSFCPRTADEYKRHIPISPIPCPISRLPRLTHRQAEDLILLNFEQKLGIHRHTAYAGEIKKSIYHGDDFSCRWKA